MIASHEISEVFYRADRLDQRQLDWLRDRGVMTHALTEPDPVLTARVAFTKTGTFDVVSVDEEGVRALLILCHGVVGEPNDIAAWPPRTGNIGMWLGRAGLIGEDEILQPRLGAPLRIFREPLWWLKSGRRGGNHYKRQEGRRPPVRHFASGRGCRSRG